MSQHNVVMLVGSSRKDSLNVRLAKAIEKVAPKTLNFNWVAMDDLPFYNGDLEGNRPDSIKRFVASVMSADAVCIVTPEYNRSIPGVLKNAIDWASKPPESNVWKGKVVAITGTSPGAIGTAIAQQHLRQILSILGSYVLPGEVYISFKSPDFIDAQGEVKDSSTRDFLAAFANRFAALIEKMSG